MGKFSFDRDYSKRVSMHRDNEQHKKRGENLSARKNQIFQKEKQDTLKAEAEKLTTPEIKTSAAAVPGLSDEEIIQQLNMLTEAFRATNGREEEKALREFAAQYHLNLRVEAAVSKTDKSAIARMVFNGGVEKPFGGYSEKFADLANYPYKYSIHPGKAEDYKLEDSPIWQMMSEEPRLAEMKGKMLEALAKAGVRPEMLPEMNLNDFKYLMFNHCAVQKGMGFAKLFQAKDENGNPQVKKIKSGASRFFVNDNRTPANIRKTNIKEMYINEASMNIQEVPVTTSAKQENVKRFIKENPQFKDMLLKVPGAKKEYVEALVKKMETSGLTDMSKELERHPDWANQPAIDVHHIINIKDCRLFEAQGKSYAAVNDYENMCIVSNGTLLDALERSNGNSGEKAHSIHGSIHAADMVFKDRAEDGSTKRTMVRLEPQPGVRCMLGFSPDMMIIDQQNQQQNDNRGLSAEAEKAAANSQAVMRNIQQNSGAMSA